jgi:hypothetical protein
MSNDSLLLTGKGEEAKIQNEIGGPGAVVRGGEGGGRNEVGAEARCGQSNASAALGAPESGRTEQNDGRGDGETVGHGDGDDPSGSRDPRRTQEGGVERGSEGFLVRGERDLGVDDLMPDDSLLLTRKEEEAKIQNEINARNVMLDGGEGGRPNEVGGDEGETFGHGDGGDPSGARDPRRTNCGDGGEPSAARRDPRGTGVGNSFGHSDAAASDGPLAAERQGERCDAERREQGALQVVPSGAGREQVVASENQQEQRRAQMERLHRVWMQTRAAKQNGAREQPGMSEARGP